VQGAAVAVTFAAKIPGWAAWRAGEMHYLGFMSNRSRYLPLGLAAALALTAAGATPGLANDIRVITPGISTGGLQNLRNRQQREIYQQRQQINRELDNLSIRQRQQRIEVPAMRPGCVPRQVGGNYGGQNC
jgi:hypothetical protein